MDNIFLRDISFYKRELEPIKQYINQSSFYLSKIKSIPYETARELIVNKIKNKQFEGMRDPIVEFYERHNYEDKEITTLPLSKFLSSIEKENLVSAPSLTCYVNTKDRKSLLSGFTDNNVKVRNISKKEAAKYKALGDIDKYHFYNGEQENSKLKNNAMSGAFSSGGSIIRNPTAHSSLTSTVRTMTSIGNAGNERLISGNRHYRNPNVTINNLISLAQNTNKDEISIAINKYNLKYPSVEDTLECIKFSTNLYWSDNKSFSKIEEFVKTLDQEERAAIVYTGDLYHLRIYNNDQIRLFLTKLSSKITNEDFEDPIKIIKDTDDMYVNYVHQICLSDVKGIGKDYSKLDKDKLNTLAGTCLNIYKVLDEYKELIQAFFLTKNLPCSVAYIRDSIRRCVVLSDTDSTMFSCDEWVNWYFNDLRFTDDAFALSGSVMFIATQCIKHNLAIYSAQLNVESSKLFMAAMKPEYVFDVFALTSVAKHYFTYIIVKEGSVYKEPELEYKGVHLKNSAAPKPIMADIKSVMTELLNTVRRGEKINLSNWVSYSANLEREIQRSVLAGEITYLGKLNIKSAEAYSESEEKSNYRYHTFWNEVFGPKYGLAPLPTYTSVKFPSLLTSKRVLQLWMNSIEDLDLRERLDIYLKRTQRKHFNTIYIPQNIVQASGIPKEISAVIDVKNLVLMHMGAHRLVLESLGFFAKKDINLTEMGY